MEVDDDDYINISSSSDDECYIKVDDDSDYDSDDDSDYCGDPSEHIDSDSRSNSPSCKVITKESLLLAQREYMKKIMDLLSLKEHHARALLIHYRWDVDRTLSIFAERGKEWLYNQAGLLFEENTSIVSPRLESFTGVVTCQICFDDVLDSESTTMDCGHRFCNSCWTEHFIVMITEGKSRRITCMAYKCSAICDEGKIRKLVGMRDSHLAEKFDRFLLESYIEDNKYVKWCPSVPHCGNAIRIDDADELYEVECTCGKQFCFSCSSDTHSPCSCMMWKLWAVKCRDESETVNWITVNTKFCPKCTKPVEKNGGCNLVYCLCGQCFCWLCGGATGRAHTWTSISGHTCGKYKENELERTERAKKELHRYTHYFNRYKAHKDSLELEAAMMDTLKRKISKILDKDEHKSKDFSCVPKGLCRLLRSRRILSLSYVFAYYMFGDELFRNEMTKNEKEMKQNLFEDLQQQFEHNVERLSKFLGEPFDMHEEDKVMETRLNIIELSTVTHNLCKKMYECIENDLLAPLVNTSHHIAPYRPDEVVKASEFVTDVL